MVEDDLDEERLIGINENKKKEKDKWDEGLKKRLKDIEKNG